MAVRSFDTNIFFWILSSLAYYFAILYTFYIEFCRAILL